MGETLVEGKYFRVHPICQVTRFNTQTRQLEYRLLDIKEGLAIEMKCDNEGHYIVVAYVKPGPKFEDVDFRSIECLKSTNTEMIDEYQNCVDFAKHVMIDLKEAEEREY